MDQPFEYSSYVTGKHFVGRRQDCASLADLLAGGRNVVLYEAPKTGKTSLVEQTLLNLKQKGVSLKVARLNLLTVRTEAEFLRRLSTELTGVSPEGECELSETLSLPWKVAAETGQKVVVFLSEFQNLDFTEDSYHLYKTFETVLREHAEDSNACYIMSGSKVNAMKEIFEHHKFFWRCAEHLPVSKVEDREVVDHVIRGFLSSGKVIENDLLLSICERFENNLWYINHFISICDTLTRGYILQPVLIDAMSMMIAVHEPRFTAMMNDLTTFQVGLLEAVVDGHKHFSTSDVIRKYGLNSSANVRRLKDALCKKEIISFNEEDEPYFLDPLFKYWVTKYFFGKVEA